MFIKILFYKDVMRKACVFVTSRGIFTIISLSHHGYYWGLIQYRDRLSILTTTKLSNTMKRLISYKALPEWGARSLPKAFRKPHNTKVGTWAKITILEGELAFYILDKNNNTLSTTTLSIDNQPGFIEPQQWHKVEPLSENLRCQLTFYCEKQDYYHKKYRLTKPHSEMTDLMRYIQSGDALDLGCGQGRNSLYLQQQGFKVTAFDANPNAIEKLKTIINEEQLDNINPHVGDANLANISKDFDLIASTVVFMFLSRQIHPEIIVNMQNQTHQGGYNLIVCAIDTPDYPCSADLPFQSPMQSGELKSYYHHWDIKKYNENVGHLHRTNENGDPIALRFATIIAQKT